MVTTLVADGSIQGTNDTIPVTLLNSAVATDSAFVSGKVYFVIEHTGATSEIGTQVTLQSDLNVTNAASDGFVYDSIEMNLTGATGNDAYDVANLTSVNGFALPMEISAGTNTVGYHVNGETLISMLTTNEGHTSIDIGHFVTGTAAADFPMALSPSSVISSGIPNPTGVTFQATNWASYVMAVGTAAQSDPTAIAISGMFNGAADQNTIYHNSGFFSYDLTYDPTATLDVNGTTETGVFMLVPTATSQIQGVIALATAELENSIYETLGTAEIFGSTADVINGATADFTVGTGANDQWGAVLRSFLVGFTAGYYGGEGKSINPQSAGTIDLDNAVNWDPSYAFGGVKNIGTTSEILVDRQSGYGSVTQIDDPYAQVFYANSNSYGAGYADALMSAYQVGGPLIPVQSGGTDLATVDLTLFGQTGTVSGYTAPEIYNYIAPNAGTYDLPDPAGTSGANISMNFIAHEPNGAG